MDKKHFSRSTAFKILLPLIIAVSIITIVKGGISFGHWIHAMIH